MRPKSCICVHKNYRCCQCSVRAKCLIPNELTSVSNPPSRLLDEKPVHIAMLAMGEFIHLGRERHCDCPRTQYLVHHRPSHLPRPANPGKGKSGDSTKNSQIIFSPIKPLFHRGNQTPTLFPVPTLLSKWRPTRRKTNEDRLLKTSTNHSSV